MATARRSQHELDEPHRLALFVSILRRGAAGAAFPELTAQLGLSAGNLACHLRRLVRAGLVQIVCNEAQGRARRTRAHVTLAARSQLLEWRGLIRARLVEVDRALGGTSNLRTAAAQDDLPPPGPASDPHAQPEAAGAAGSMASARSLVEERFDGPD